MHTASQGTCQGHRQRPAHHQHHNSVLRPAIVLKHVCDWIRELVSKHAVGWGEEAERWELVSRVSKQARTNVLGPWLGLSPGNIMR